MPHSRPRHLTAMLTALLLAAAVTPWWAVPAQAAPVLAAAAPAAPAAPQDPATVSADALPTTQINGVVWKQVIVGNKVFVGGEFTNARPAGAAAGVNTVPRANMLAYDIRTGELDPSFAPSFNGKVVDMAVTPDKSKLVVVGNFTTVNGANRYRVAMFDTASGALSSVAPVLDAPAQSVAVTNSTIYVGGYFSRAGNTPRARIAALNIANGTALPFTVPVDNGQVQALVLSPDSSQLVLAGNFTSVAGSGSPGYGLYRVDAVTGAGLPLPLNSEVRNAGANSAILKLASDGDSFYGAGYHFGAGGNLEGMFRASWSDGSLVNMEDCHGDTYDIAPVGNVVYSASHKHYCGNSGGFPQTTPWTFWWSTAWTKETRGTNTRDIYGYPDHPGTPRPDLLAWNPQTDPGTYTGKSQSVWSVTGNDQYVVYGGEFPKVNGTGQQGLVRYAARAIAPNKQGPRPTVGSTFVPSVKSFRRGQVQITWPAMWDRDDATLSYSVVRDNVNTVVSQQQQTNRQWDGKVMSFTDTGLAPGSTTRYNVRVTDPSGNLFASGWINVTVAASDQISAHGAAVLDDGASKYWPLNEPAGSTTVSDFAGADHTTSGTGVTRGTQGAMQNSSDSSSSFNASASGLVASQQLIPGPNTFSQEVWFKTSSTSGGKIAGFGSSRTGDSGSYDRHLYMDEAGRVLFGVYPGATRTVSSAAGLNDGQWHQAVATLGSNGMVLYIDGKRVGSRTDTTNGQAYDGYWRLGGDNTWAGGKYFNGQIDDYSVFPTVLNPQQVNNHWVASGRTSALPTRPSDALGRALYDSEPDLYWRLDDAGDTAADSAMGSSPGSYTGTYTRGEAGVIAGNASVRLGGPSPAGNVTSRTAVANPTAFSQEVWVKTTTTSGGRILGFGNSATGGFSSNYDRHLWMLDNGKVRFGVYNGSTVMIESNASLNDGRWHQLVSTFDGSGMKLYVDGELNGTNPNTSAQNYAGYWKLGADNTWGGNSTPAFRGQVDEAAIFPRALAVNEVRQHFAAGGGSVANAAPVAAFTSQATDLRVDFDASGSSDADGSVVSYSWKFGDGETGSGATPSHTFPRTGSFEVELTVTDDLGGTATETKLVEVVAANVAPSAAFTTEVANLRVGFDGSGSADADGTVASYSWDFGDGSPVETGPRVAHTYARAGTFTVRLSVTDNRGGTGTEVKQVTVRAANVGPTASFASSASGLVVSVDGSGSSDPDGSIASYSWDFGDGSPVVAGRTAQRGYAAAGSYPVTLTVTDNDGASAQVQRLVVVSAPASNVLASDGFDRTVANGWGSAEQGGAWTLRGGNNRFGVAGSAGTVSVAAGQSPGADLTSVSSSASVLTTEFSVDKVVESNYVSLVGRQVGASSYVARLRIAADGTSRLFLLRDDNTQLGSTIVPSFPIVAGTRYKISMQVSGTSPTTISAKIWRSSDVEPTAWQRTVTDSTAALQAAGTVGLFSYLPKAATNAPVTVTWDNISARRPAQ